MNIEACMRMAKLASTYSDCRHCLGCAIYKRNRLISIGFNICKTHTKFSTFTLHAECSAILHARSDVSGATLFVYREYSNGTPALAKPCQECYKFILMSGIKRIYYTSTGMASPVQEVLEY